MSQLLVVLPLRRDVLGERVTVVAFGADCFVAGAGAVGVRAGVVVSPAEAGEDGVPPVAAVTLVPELPELEEPADGVSLVVGVTVVELAGEEAALVL